MLLSVIGYTMLHQVQKDKRVQQGERVDTAKFTPREVDVLAALISGKSYKSIAVLLFISPKTVDVHVHHIMEKLGCHSREGITAMVEQSPLFSPLKKRYLALLMIEDLPYKLKHIAQLSKNTHMPICMVVDAQTRPEAISVPNLLEQLKTAGINVIEGTLEDPRSADAVVCLINSEPKKVGQDVVAYFEKITSKFDIAIFVVPESDNSKVIKQGNAHIVQYDGGCPLLIFDILKCLLPNLPVEEIKMQFKQQWKEALDLANKEQEIDCSIWKQEAEQNQKIVSLKQYVQKRTSVFWVCLVSSFLVAGGAVWMGIKDIIFASPASCVTPVRSTLPIPSDTYLLQRPLLIRQIAEKLNGTEPIQTVVLLAMGGMGKTTIARQYAKGQKASVVWEIDAESQETLLDTFGHLAYALSRNADEKQELLKIKQLGTKEHSKKLISFIQQKLKLRTDWILIFDNVDNLLDIAEFLPNDSQSWGEGKVLITTRNQHIQDSHHINKESVIDISPLDVQEQLSLFMRIMSSKNDKKLRAIEKQEIVDFLKKIPPFPLDVSAAAHHVKSTGMSFQEYLDNMHSPEMELEKLQYNFLKQTMHYGKTRYEIITFAFKELIKSCPAIEEILFFISMIGSQNIPKDLLDLYKDKKAVAQFIDHMQQFSLLTHKISENKHQFVSIHRSTQQIASLYLTHALSAGKQQKYLDDIMHALEYYCADILERVDIEKMGQTAHHLKILLKHTSILGVKNEGKAQALLGCLYYYFGDIEKTKNHLEAGLMKLGRTQPPSIIMARSLTYLGINSRQYGNYKKAQKLGEESLALYQKFFHTCHDEINFGRMQLGNTLMFEGSYEKAKQLLEQSVDFYMKKYGLEDLRVARCASYLTDIYLILGDYKKAQYFGEMSLVTYKKLYGDHHLTSGRIMRLGVVFKGLGEYKKAENLLQKSCALCQASSEYQNSLTWTLMYLSEIQSLLGLSQKAKQSIDQSLEINAKYRDENNIETAWRTVYLGQVHLDMGNYEEARRLLEYCFKLHEKHYHPQDNRIGWCAHKLANAYKYLGLFAYSQTFFAKSLNNYEDHYGKNHIEYAKVLNDFGHLHIFQKEYDKAEEMINQALVILQENTHPEAYKCLEYLGDLYHAKGAVVKDSNQQELKKFKDQARDYYKKAMTIAQANFPKESAHIGRIQEKLIRP